MSEDCKPFLLGPGFGVRVVAESFQHRLTFGATARRDGRNPSARLRCGAALGLLVATAACGTAERAKPDSDVIPEVSTALAINEVVAANSGVWIDETGETEDWIELINRSSAALSLSEFWLEDATGERAQLGGSELGPGERRLLWADGDTGEANVHLPFKLDDDGDLVRLSDALGRVVDEIALPPLGENEALARFPDATGNWLRCRYASPQRANGEACVPPEPPSLVDDVEFERFSLATPYPPALQGLDVTELSLRPSEGADAYIELFNRGTDPVLLDDYRARLAVHAPHLPWPSVSDGDLVPFPAGESLAPGARLLVQVSDSALSALEADAGFEGVLTVFRRVDGEIATRVDFMSWPRGATLMQAPENVAAYRFCTNGTPGTANECSQLASRPIGDRLRHLRTPGDFAALANGSTELDVQSVKFVVDLTAPGLVHLLSAARWPLHYTFVRERVYLEPELDRCDPDQSSEFDAGWRLFSSREYYSVEGRRFLLGTLSHYGGTGLDLVEYTYGDAISASQMRNGFFAVLPHTFDPIRWILHPQDDTQVAKARAIEGTVPLIGPNAPFAGVTYQPLTEGVAFGTLRFVPASELLSASLGPDVIVVTDDVPNDIPFVGGLITEAFQTPLAHVNVLSQNRGTPNASLKAARTELAEHFGTLVRLEVAPGGLDVRAADPREALEHWESQRPSGPLVAARLDTSLRGVQPLRDHGFGSLPAIGAKAAQLAELGQGRAPYCGRQLEIVTPETPFAIPVVHSLEHFEASGARELLAELETQSEFLADSRARSLALERVRRLILSHPVDPVLLAEVEGAVRERFGEARVRFRSSSNTEDLPGFNGAGLYTSTSAELGDDSRRVEDALRTVWASLYNARAYDERTYARIDGSSVAMGVLVHPAHLAEQANGVAVSRNILDPTRGDIYYLNAQDGEASVTNPAPGVATEQLVYRWGREPPILYQSESSLLRDPTARDGKVLSSEEVVDVSCALYTIHETFRPLLDPEGLDPWFAMEIEFKLMGPERRLAIKQARPHSFGRPAPFRDCREL